MNFRFTQKKMKCQIMNFHLSFTQMKLPKMNFIYSKLWTVTFFRLFAEKVSKKRKDDGSDV